MTERLVFAGRGTERCGDAPVLRTESRGRAREMAPHLLRALNRHGAPKRLGTCGARFGTLGELAEFEREMIVARVDAGLARFKSAIAVTGASSPKPLAETCGWSLANGLAV